MLLQLRNQKHPHVIEVEARLIAMVIEQADGLIYLDMQGPEVALNAIWANIVKHRTKRSVTPTNVYVFNPELGRTMDTRDWLHVLPGCRYFSRMVHKTRHVMFNSFASKISQKYIFGGDDQTPSPWFKTALQKNVDLPFIPEWLDIIWQKAVERGHVLPVPAHNINCWHIDYSADWHQILLELREEDKLIWQGLPLSKSSFITPQIPT